MIETGSPSRSDAADPVASAAHAQVVQMAVGHVIAQAMYALAELGIPDLLKDGPRTADEIALATRMHAARDVSSAARLGRPWILRGDC